MRIYADNHKDTQILLPLFASRIKTSKYVFVVLRVRPHAGIKKSIIEGNCVQYINQINNTFRFSLYFSQSYFFTVEETIHIAIKVVNTVSICYYYVQFLNKLRKRFTDTEKNIFCFIKSIITTLSSRSVDLT